MMAERCERRRSGLETLTTGPRSPEGMARWSQNAFKSGTRPLLRTLSRALMQHRKALGEWLSLNDMECPSHYDNRNRRTQGVTVWREGSNRNVDTGTARLSNRRRLENRTRTRMFRSTTLSLRSIGIMSIWVVDILSSFGNVRSALT